MNWQKYPAILMILMLLMLPQFALGETAAEAPAPSQAEEAPVQEETKPKLYYLLVDCGYAFYGSAHFDTSVVQKPGDPDGNVLAMLQEYFIDLIPADAHVVVKGYHSDLVQGQGTKPVPVSEVAQVGMQFEALRMEPVKNRQSSLPDKALDREYDRIAEYARNYDCTLILVTGGVLNRNGGTANTEKLIQHLEDIRNLGVTIRAFGLEGVLLPDKDGAQFEMAGAFQPGEYMAAAVTDPGRASAYADAHVAMMADIVYTMAGLQGGVQPIICRPLTDEEVLGKLDGMGETDTVYRFGWYRTGETGHGYIMRRYSPEALRDSLPESGVSSCESCVYVFCKGLALPDDDKRAEAEAAQRKQIEEMYAWAKGNMGGAVAAPLDMADQEIRILLPECYAAERVKFDSADTNKLELRIEENVLVLVPKAMGETYIRCRLPGRAPVDMPVSITNTHISWSAEDGACLNRVDGAVVQISVPDNELVVQVTADSGPLAGQTFTENDPEGSPVRILCTETDGASTVSVELTQMGRYTVECCVRSGDIKLKTTQRSYQVQSPVDPMEEICLIYPYLGRQEGQTLQLTGGGAPVDAGFYQMTVTPQGALGIETNPDGTATITPARSGTATITISEKDLDTPSETVLTIQVKHLTSGWLFWVSIGCLAIGLASLTAGVVVMVRKGNSKGRKGRK